MDEFSFEPRHVHVMLSGKEYRFSQKKFDLKSVRISVNNMNKANTHTHIICIFLLIIFLINNKYINFLKFLYNNLFSPCVVPLLASYHHH